MRTITIVFAGAALALCATCGQAQQDQGTQQNVPAAQNPNLQPANPQASKPGNMGNGLQWGMSPRDANRTFDRLDTNHDGYVDESEFMVNGDSGQRFAGCDANGDGKLSRAEFVNCAQASPAQQ